LTGLPGHETTFSETFEFYKTNHKKHKRQQKDFELPVPLVVRFS